MSVERRPSNTMPAGDAGGMSEMHRKRRGRNIALLVVLGALVVLFYTITIVKMSGVG